jgi:HD-like signal output (HDOD) protein
MDAWKKRWGSDQWAAYFETKKLPVMGKSKLMVESLLQREGEELSPHDLALVVLNDPLLCLRLLREAERIRTHRLGNETTTTLQAIMQIGIDGFKSLLFASDEIDKTNRGLLEVEARSSIAAQIAMCWASRHSDLRPSELSLAVLLVNTGELLLWLYEPDLPRAAVDELHSGRARRSSQAQRQACGFEFRELTIRCAEIWHLPELLCQLLRSTESSRSKLTRLCSNTARHLISNDEGADLALASDLHDALKLIPEANLEELAGDLPGVSEERRSRLIGLTRDLS